MEYDKVERKSQLELIHKFISQFKKDYKLGDKPNFLQKVGEGKYSTANYKKLEAQKKNPDTAGSLILDKLEEKIYKAIRRIADDLFGTGKEPGVISQLRALSGPRPN